VPEPLLPPDNHVHTEWSYDTGDDASMVAACRRAIERGLPAIAFTEHVDAASWQPDDGLAVRSLTRTVYPALAPLDIDGYLACVAECRSRFPELRILTGVELGEPHLHASTVGEVLARHPFERTLGSLHVIPTDDGRLVDAWTLLPDATADQAAEHLRRYFAEMLHLVGSDAPFEVLAHLDFPRRFWPSGGGPYAERAFEAEYRAVLRVLAGSGRVLEVNTRTPLASVDLVRWWREEGGRAVSFGSDAHVPWAVGDRFELATDVVEAAGFRRGADRFDFWRVHA
jgi:histidinol-phosphatase (PHP family)